MPRTPFPAKSAVVSFLLGAVIGPVVMPAVKPYLRQAAKRTIGMGMQAKKFAAEAVEDLQDMAAEAGAEATKKNASGASVSAVKNT